MIKLPGLPTLAIQEHLELERPSPIAFILATECWQLFARASERHRALEDGSDLSREKPLPERNHADE